MADHRDAEAIMARVVQGLTAVRGVRAIVLGGSRAKGTHRPESDLDIGIFYGPDEELDLEALGRLASELDDEGKDGLITPVGGWGPWINGGGWLQVGGLPVDFLYRDLSRVERVIGDCARGEVTIDYQPGHPHGFVNAIYMAEIASCLPLWDPDGSVARLRAMTDPYPQALRAGIMRKFGWEAGFTAANARKAVGKLDANYVAGCCFRAVACLNQTLFALNGRYLMNEKGAVDEAQSFPLALPRYRASVNGIFASLSPDAERLADTVEALDRLIREAEALIEENR
ncbi:nucleotidyltransferase domain-containing protein [Cohnella nanjingensis]|uniref:Nucleotidyltransferase domain-containing protein n=1 Tax=Cohnella nanjingensis TaxID=1387779 RepID=A0A7X0RWC1_9BACL|nr:nucleotidyltransferase domain-containing protein [Cohnella nanjingensis]MBB6674862.1 nucleotidyltransferase domain-containing protein [Cohnella nanjingensis]